MFNYPHWLIMLTNSLQVEQDGYVCGFFLPILVPLSLSFTFVKVGVTNKEPDHLLM